MKAMKINSFLITAVIIIAAYLLQCTVFSSIELAGIKPNLLIIVTASFGFMRGSREGVLVGFVSGLSRIFQFGDMIGFYALIYLLVGYINGCSRDCIL